MRGVPRRRSQTRAGITERALQLVIAHSAAAILVFLEPIANALAQGGLGMCASTEERVDDGSTGTGTCLCDTGWLPPDCSIPE